MNCLELYNSYKNKYPNDLVIIKDGALYRTYFEDAKVLWHMFDLKYQNESTMFSEINYNHVINELKDKDIGFIIVTKEKVFLNQTLDTISYKIYVKKAVKSYQNINTEEVLIKKLKEVLKKHKEYSEIIGEYLEMLLTK